MQSVNKILATIVEFIINAPFSLTTEFARRMSAIFDSHVNLVNIISICEHCLKISFAVSTCPRFVKGLSMFYFPKILNAMLYQYRINYGKSNLRHGMCLHCKCLSKTNFSTSVFLMQIGIQQFVLLRLFFQKENICR